MIGTIDVNVQAAKPGFPLAPVRAFVSSPSSLRIRNVPRRIGEWEITAVRVSVDYPDGTTASADCVQIAGVWVGTIRGCAVPGNALRGFRVTADGVDERGEDVTGYVLGVGDVEILNRETAVTPETQTFKGDPGADGETPIIGDNGNWWIGGIDTGKPARGPKGETGETPDVVAPSESATTGQAADAKATHEALSKVQTLKINDEWRFSVASGLSGGMAIRLEHLDFPAQGIWGIQTEMTIPTGLGTLAKSADVPEISTTFTSADAGKAAESKAVGEALNGKLDNPSGDDNSLSFSAESMYFNNAYGVNYLYYPNFVGGDASKDAELMHNGFELIATRFWVEWYLAQETVKTALFAGADFIAAVKKYGGTQIKEDEKGFYYEVEEA